MADEKVKYYEMYGELIRSKKFLQRVVILLTGINLLLIVICYIGFTRPGQTFVIRDGYAFTGYPYEFKRSIHEVRMFCHEFSKNLLEFSRDNFNERIRNALRMCSQELEYVMYNTIKASEIPKVVQNTPGSIQFKVKEILIKKGDPFKARVSGAQIFPGQEPINIMFDLDITVVPRSEKNPFGLRVINFKQG